MGYALMVRALAALLVAGTSGAAQVPVETLLVEETPVHPAAYGFVYYSTLTPVDVALRDGSRAELWMFDGAAGECVAIVGSSDAFAVQLLLREATPFGRLIAHDDSRTESGDARLRLELPHPGRYFVTVTSVGAGEALGAYTLDLDRC